MRTGSTELGTECDNVLRPLFCPTSACTLLYAFFNYLQRAAPTVWNSLDVHTRSADTFLTFKNRLKTELFKSCYV